MGYVFLCFRRSSSWRGSLFLPAMQTSFSRGPSYQSLFSACTVYNWPCVQARMGFPGGSVDEMQETFDPGAEEIPGEGNGSPLQYSCLGNPWTEDPGRLQSMGSQRVRHYRTTDTFSQFATGPSLQPLGGSVIMRHEVLSTSFKLSTVLDDKNVFSCSHPLQTWTSRSESSTCCTALACVMIIAGQEA